MLVSVIVLLTLMFFIGSAMALAVSSSLHTIAQTNNVDSTAYAGETAVAQGLARTATPNPSYGPAHIGSVLNGSATPVGCNNGLDGNETGNNQQHGSQGGQHDSLATRPTATAAAANLPVTAPPLLTSTWSYAYEVVADGYLVGRSKVGSGQGPDAITTSNYQTITIDPVT